ncbi:MAG: DNA polymerase III subunit beta [Actinobacteria bacterium]|nr:DNA polymerase III subunit beta [Actinomycetota bacterium]
MEIRVERDALVDAVNWVSRTLPSRATTPVLTGILIDIDRDHSKPLRLSSSDHESSSQIHIDADINDPSPVVVSGHLFATIARSLPAAPIVITTTENSARLVCGRAVFQLPVMNAADYPALPEMPATCGTVPGATFATAISQVVTAAGKSDNMPMLSGVRMEIANNIVTLAATDRFRMAMREMGWSPTSPSDEIGFLIPAKVLSDTARALAGCEAVHLAYAKESGALLGFEGDDRRTTTRLMDGDFPKFRSILPASTETNVTIDTAGFLETVKRVALVSDKTKPLRLTFGEDEVTVTAGADTDATATDVFECRTRGEGMTIAFNADYLVDGLNAVNAPVTGFGLNDPSKPAVLQGLASHDGEPTGEYRYLLMPVRLT